MVNFVNKEILVKVDKVIDEIKNSKDYQQYQYLKEKLSKHEKANNFITEIKKIQKEIIKKEVSKQDTTNLEKELNQKLDSLNKIPLYIEFVNSQEKLNNIYQVLKKELDDYFYNISN